MPVNSPPVPRGEGVASQTAHLGKTGSKCSLLTTMRSHGFILAYHFPQSGGKQKMKIFKGGGGIFVFYKRLFSQTPNHGAEQYYTFFYGASDNGFRFATLQKEGDPGWVSR